jgi:LmbE family N-acetylglucosaminyl deacetylase
MKTKMKILAIGAHPDDVEIFCGGTIAKYAAKGHEIVMVSVTNGEIGSKELSCEEIIKIRRKEGEAAAKVIGAEYVWMGYRDQQFMITND